MFSSPVEPHELGPGVKVELLEVRRRLVYLHERPDARTELANCLRDASVEVGCENSRDESATHQFGKPTVSGPDRRAGGKNLPEDFSPICLRSQQVLDDEGEVFRNPALVCDEPIKQAQPHLPFARLDPLCCLVVGGYPVRINTPRDSPDALRSHWDAGRERRAGSQEHNRPGWLVRSEDRREASYALQVGAAAGHQGHFMSRRSSRNLDPAATAWSAVSGAMSIPCVARFRT